MLIYHNSCFQVKIEIPRFIFSEKRYILNAEKEYSRVAEMVFRFHRGGCICRADVNHSMIQFHNDPDTIGIIMLST